MKHPFAAILVEARQRLNLTQQDIADRIGRSSSAIGLMESGKRQPDLDVIPTLARALEKDPKALIEQYLHLFHPGVARELFDHPAPAVGDRKPEDANPEVVCGLSSLPPQLRAPIEHLILALIRQY